MYPYYSTARQVPTHPAIVSRNGTQDERFFPLLPFVAGLAIGPLLFNRPNYYPPYPPVMYPYPYPYPSPYPVYQGYPGGLGPGYYPQTYGAQPGITENINIYS